MFEDRAEAAELLADRLAGMALSEPVVLGLPRGGVPVAAVVAQRLNAPLDIVLVRKIGMPRSPEFAAGALVEDGEPVFNEDVLRLFGLSGGDFADSVERERAELIARRRRFRGDSAPVSLAGRDAVVVDDGIATGATARAALRGLRGRGPARVILAVPVAPADTIEALRPLADEVVCLETPPAFQAVSLHYRRFGQVSDDEVVALLNAARAAGGAAPPKGQEKGNRQ